jgi:hypothetical protein
VIQIAVMSDTLTIERDTKTGRFVAGNSGNGGRRPGSRNRLGEKLLSDLADGWETHGKDALIACAEQEPGRFAQICVGLLPKETTIDLNVDVLHDVTSAVQAFRTLSDALGTEPQVSKRQMKQITSRISGDVLEG